MAWLGTAGQGFCFFKKLLGGFGMKTIHVTMTGISALLMHRFPMEPIEAIEKKSPEEQARIALYEQDGQPFIPGVNVQRALVAGATFSKGKGRSSLQKSVAAGLFVDEAQLPIKDAKWVVDARPVTIPATKGRVVRYRPRFDKWSVDCTISFDETLLTETQVRRIVDDTGSRVGLLDFRPERKGPFGRFMVMAWSNGG
jgi:hypothetical protein